MANYLTTFNTYADYSGATLDLPNVSLIKSEGKVYYKNIFAGAVLGDILMYDVANDKLVCTVDAQWDATTYPIASYEPIAINIYPASQTPDNKARFMALKWASNASASGSTTVVQLLWGPNSTTAGDITSTDENALNGRANTDKAVAAMPNTSGNTQDEYPIFYAVNQFYTNGTSAGDWYVPSKHELDLYQANYATINANITLIKNASSSIVNTVNSRQWCSTEKNTVLAWSLTNNGEFVVYEARNNSKGVRGVISL